MSEKISIKDASRISGYSRSAIYLFIGSGKLPHEMIAGRVVIRLNDAKKLARMPRPKRGRKPNLTVAG